MELFFVVVLLVGGLVGGAYLSKKLQGKTIEPKQSGQIPPKAPPPPTPTGHVPKPAAWPPAPPPVAKKPTPPKGEVRSEAQMSKRPPAPPPPPPVRMVQSHTGREIPKPTQPVDDGFATSMALGALTGSAALGYLAGGNLVGAMVGSAINDDDTPSKRTETYSAPSFSNDDDSYSKPSSSYDSGSSWGSSDSSSDSSSSWSSSD